MDPSPRRRRPRDGLHEASRKPSKAASHRGAILAAVLSGALCGLVGSLVMYALLFPTMRGAPVPPERFAQRFVPTAGRGGGFVVQVLFGLFWGAVAGLYGDNHAPLMGSELTQGLVVGVFAFISSLGGFATFGLLRPNFDWREWIGHFLNHLVFGLVLGTGLLVVSRIAP